MLIVLCAIITALTFVAGLIPFAFFIPLLVVITLQDIRLTIYSALCFGVVSFVYSFMYSSPLALAFVAMPWIPIVMRLLAALGAHFAYAFCARMISHPLRRRAISAAVGAVVGSVLNSVLVIGSVLLFATGSLFSALLVATPVYVSSGLFEMVLNPLLVAPISLALYRALFRAQRPIVTPDAPAPDLDNSATTGESA